MPSELGFKSVVTKTRPKDGPFHNHPPVTPAQLAVLQKMAKQRGSYADRIAEGWYQPQNGGRGGKQEVASLEILFQYGYVNATVDTSMSYSMPNGVESEKTKRDYHFHRKYQIKGWIAEALKRGETPELTKA